ARVTNATGGRSRPFGAAPRTWLSTVPFDSCPSVVSVRSRRHARSQRVRWSRSGCLRASAEDACRRVPCRLIPGHDTVVDLGSRRTPLGRETDRAILVCPGAGDLFVHSRLLSFHVLHAGRVGEVGPLRSFVVADSALRDGLAVSNFQPQFPCSSRP